MGAHLIDGEFQSDKCPGCPRGKVPLSVRDPKAQPHLWAFAQDWRSTDAEFSDDLETALRAAGYVPSAPPVTVAELVEALEEATEALEDRAAQLIYVAEGDRGISRWRAEHPGKSADKSQADSEESAVVTAIKCRTLIARARGAK